MSLLQWVSEPNLCQTVPRHFNSRSKSWRFWIVWTGLRFFVFFFVCGVSHDPAVKRPPLSLPPSTLVNQPVNQRWCVLMLLARTWAMKKTEVCSGNATTPMVTDTTTKVGLARVSFAYHLSVRVSFIHTLLSVHSGGDRAGEGRRVHRHDEQPHGKHEVWILCLDRVNHDEPEPLSQCVKTNCFVVLPRGVSVNS